MDTPSNLPGDFPVDSFTIMAFCDTCDHRAPLDRARVSLGVTVQALRGRLRCSACGHRGRSIPVVYTGGYRNAISRTPWRVIRSGKVEILDSDDFGSG